MTTTPIYALRVSEVFRALETLPDGLPSGEARQRIALYGPNVLSEPIPPPIWLKFIGHAAHPMALLLLGAGALAFISGRWTLGIVIAIVVLVNAAFTFWQEHRAEEAVAALKKLLPTYARVIRSEDEIRIPASDIVPGDVLILAEGDNIPADARVVEEFGLRINNATLTGEALPARKMADASLADGITEVERPNLVFAGTSVVSGTGRAVVYATGMTTQFGRIANLTQAVEDPPSLLLQNLRRITRFITYLAISTGVIVALIGSFDVGMDYVEAIVLGIGIIVAAVPEGLLPTVTLTLAIAVQRLAQSGVLVKKLAVVETLGTVSVICTDKSGTLTQNQMTVREIWLAGQRLSVSGEGYNPKGEFRPLTGARPLESDLNILMAAALLCNNARLIPPSPENPKWSSLGDQTEAALRVLALKGGANEEVLTDIFPRVHELPFDARRKRMTTVHRDVYGETAYVKGAPKEVLALCTSILWHGEIRPLDNDLRASIVAVNDRYAQNALRVLALARRELPEREGAYRTEEIERDLTFLGLAAMMDPPRPEVAQAAQICNEASIRLVMITGDYGLTAASLAKRVGMLKGDNPLIVTGAELDAMSDDALQKAIQGEIIFARMAPEHKLRLVAAFQARGDVVAVVGDGVNDAPALRKADVGIAMGITGTDVAKEAADLILTDDNVADVMVAIQEGRTIFDNLRKFTTYIFASNVPEIVPFVLMALLKIPLALNVLQILAIDLGTDLLPALALGTDRPAPEVMQQPPRRRDSPLLDRGLLLRAFVWLGGIEAILCYAGFFLVFRAYGYTDILHLPRVDLLSFAERLASPEGQVYLLASTVFHAGVVTSQIGNAFACRTERGRVRRLGFFSNKFLLAGIAFEVLVILALIYIPPLAQVFEHRPLPLHYWIGLTLYAPILYMLDWLRRWYVRKVRRVQQQRGSNGSE